MAGMPSPNMTALLSSGVDHHQNNHHQHHHASQRSPLGHTHPESAPLLLSSSSPSSAAATAVAVFKREEAEADALHKLRQSSARLGAVVPPASHNAHQPLRSAPIDIVRFGPDGEPFDASALRCPPTRHNLHHAGRQGKTRGNQQPSRKGAASSNAGVIVGDSSSSSSSGDGIGSEANDSAFFSAASLADSPLDRAGVVHSLPFANASDAETRHVLAGGLDRPDVAHSLGRMHVRPRAYPPADHQRKGGVERGDMRDVYEHHHHNFNHYNYDSVAPLPEPPQLHQLPASAILSPSSRTRPLGTSPLARRLGHCHGQSPAAGGPPARSMPMATTAFEAGSSGSASGQVSGYGSPSLGMAGSPTSSLGSSGSLSSLRRGLRAARTCRPPPPASAARRLSLEEPGTPQRAMITISEDATIDYSGCETEDPAILSMLRAKARSSVAVPPKNDWLVQDLHAALTELRSQHLDDDSCLSVPMRALLDGRLERDLRDLGLKSAVSLLGSPRATTHPSSDGELDDRLTFDDGDSDLDDDTDTDISRTGDAFVPDAVMSFLEHFLPATDLALLRRAVDARQCLASTDSGDEAGLGGSGLDHAADTHSPSDGISADVLALKLQALAVGTQGRGSKHTGGFGRRAGGGAGDVGGDDLSAGLSRLFGSAAMGSSSGQEGEAILLPLSLKNPYDLDENYVPHTPRG